jgi:type IV secretory pathway TrbD component
MIGFLRTLVRRVATLAAVLFGALLAALFAALALAAGLALGAAVWLASRFGMRAVRPASSSAQRDREVIDVQMREVAPDDDATQRDAPPASPASNDDAGRGG